MHHYLSVKWGLESQVDSDNDYLVDSSDALPYYRSQGLDFSDTIYDVMTDSVIGLEQDQLNKDLRYYQESIVNIDFNSAIDENTLKCHIQQ